MNQPKLFGKRIRAVRRSAKLTQEQLAEAGRLNPKYLGQIERGEKRPSFEAIVDLARALRVSPSTLFLFDFEETDGKVLRRKIDSLLQGRDVRQLQQAYRLLKAAFEP